MVANIRMYDQQYTVKVQTGERWVEWILSSIKCNGVRVNNPDFGWSISADGSSDIGVKPLLTKVI